MNTTAAPADIADAIVGGFERLEAQLERIATLLERDPGPGVAELPATLPAMREARPDFGLDELLILARRWARELLASGHPPELRTFMHAVVADTDLARQRADVIDGDGGDHWPVARHDVHHAIKALAEAVVAVGRIVQKELGA